VASTPNAPIVSAYVRSGTGSAEPITAPNSLPRTIKIIALDLRSESILERIGEEQWKSASFLTPTAFSTSAGQRRDVSLQRWLSDLAGRTRDLVNVVQGADSVIMVVTAGEDTEAAALIGEACGIKHVPLTAVVLSAASCSEKTLETTLSQLRPHVAMLVVSHEDEYVGDMLEALRA
jgi:hypothetical protein